MGIAKEYLVQKQQQAKRELLIVLLVWFGLIPVVVGIRWVTPWQVHAIAAYAWIAFLVAGLLCVAWRTDVRCPWCRRSLQWKDYCAYVLATGKCRHMETRLLTRSSHVPSDQCSF